MYKKHITRDTIIILFLAALWDINKDPGCEMNPSPLIWGLISQFCPSEEKLQMWTVIDAESPDTSERYNILSES